MFSKVNVILKVLNVSDHSRQPGRRRCTTEFFESNETNKAAIRTVKDIKFEIKKINIKIKSTRNGTRRRSAGHDDPMPQLISPAPNPRHRQFYKDHAFISKSPKHGTPLSQDSSQNEESTAEEIIETYMELIEPAEETSPHNSSVSSYGSKIDYITSTPLKATTQMRVSHS